MSEYQIVYLHGFGSQFDPDSEKVSALRQLGTVEGPDIDYTQGFQSILDQAMDYLNEREPDLLVGTSMGGWLSGQLSERLGMPFVACNPAIQPSASLAKYLGEGVDYQGKPYNLTEADIRELPDFSLNGTGIVLLDLADEVIPAKYTQECLEHVYTVHAWEGGNHRFTHMVDALPLIKEHCLSNAI